MKRLLVAAVAAVLLATTTSAAQANTEPLCALLQACGGDPDDPYPDPDPDPVPVATQIVFTNSSNGRPDLYMVDSATGVVSEVPGVNTDATERDPVVSPDGKRVAFSSDRGGDFDIYLSRRLERSAW